MFYAQKNPLSMTASWSPDGYKHSSFSAGEQEDWPRVMGKMSKSMACYQKSPLNILTTIANLPHFFITSFSPFFIVSFPTHFSSFISSSLLYLLLYLSSYFLFSLFPTFLSISCSSLPVCSCILFTECNMF